jgi:hypothetical protein
MLYILQEQIALVMDMAYEKRLLFTGQHMAKQNIPIEMSC